MSKDPAFLFYSSDFLTGTFCMTNEQVGKYIRLLCLQHQKFSLTEKDMLNICSSYDKDIWSKFEVDDSGFYNKRLREEAQKRKSYSESRKNNRKKKDMLNISKTYVSHMENENENENINDNVLNNKNVKKSKNNFFNHNDVGELPEITIGSAIELLKITKQITSTTEEINGLWSVFKIQNLDGKTYYASENKVYSHFINWLKHQKLEKNESKSKSATTKSGIDQLRNKGVSLVRP